VTGEPGTTGVPDVPGQAHAAGVSAGHHPGRRVAVVVGVRAAGTVVVLLVLYYVLPLDLLTEVPLPVILTVALTALAVVTGLQVRSIVQATYPALRAVEALAVTAPLFLLLFAAVYEVMSAHDPGAFGEPALSRTDALYFTVTVFATVGFGDITARSEPARVLVTVQMMLDLVVLGLGIRLFVGAVERGRRRAGRIT